jgi:hypothetical protein
MIVVIMPDDDDPPHSGSAARARPGPSLAWPGRVTGMTVTVIMIMPVPS